MNEKTTNCTFYKYLKNKDAELFTLVCLPVNIGRFPTVIFRSPYVDEEENTSYEELCNKKACEYEPWLRNGYAVVFLHFRGTG